MDKHLGNELFCAKSMLAHGRRKSLSLSLPCILERDKHDNVRIPLSLTLEYIP